MKSLNSFSYYLSFLVLLPCAYTVYMSGVSGKSSSDNSSNMVRSYLTGFLGGVSFRFLNSTIGALVPVTPCNCRYFYIIWCSLYIQVLTGPVSVMIAVIILSLTCAQARLLPVIGPYKVFVPITEWRFGICICLLFVRLKYGDLFLPFLSMFRPATSEFEGFAPNLRAT